MKSKLTFLIAGLAGVAITALTVSGAEFAVSFSGTAQSGSVSSPAFNAFPLTVMLWAKTDQTNGGGALLAKRSNSQTNGYEITITNGQLRAFYARNATNYVGNPNSGLSGGFLADTNWHHVAFAVDTNGGRLYLDGSLRDSLGWTGPAGALSNSSALLLAIGV